MKWRALAGLGIWWLVAAGAAVGLAVIVLGGSHVKAGGYIFAGSLAVAALARLALPSPRGGGLEVRRRSVDVALLVTLAVGVTVAVALVQLTPA